MAQKRSPTSDYAIAYNEAVSNKTNKFSYGGNNYQIQDTKKKLGGKTKSRAVKVSGSRPQPKRK